MRITDEFNGVQPFSGDMNLLSYLRNEKHTDFIEPLQFTWDFQHTYPINYTGGVEIIRLVIRLLELQPGQTELFIPDI